MKNLTVSLPSYTIGENVLNELGNECSKYGKRILFIGGKTAIDKSKNLIEESIKNSKLEIIDFVCYGGECTYENMDKLTVIAREKNAELIVGVGGGRAIDTAKGVANNLKLPIISIPTIAATCAAITSLSVVYKESGDFDSFYFYDKPPTHCFMDSKIIAEAPDKYLRAGIGDTMAKHYECTLASRDDSLNHSSAMAREISKMCVEPLLKHGKKALEDCKKNINSFEVEQVILNNVISTGLVSLLIEEKYNGALAHSLFYGLTLLPHIEKDHLHGDVVAYGILVQLAVDGQVEELTKIFNFCKSVGIPTSLKEIEVKNDREFLDAVLEETVNGPDMEHLPYKIAKDMIFDAIQVVEDLNLGGK